MIYQITTSGKLCQSKRYFKTKQEVKDHLRMVVKLTMLHYSKKEIPQTISYSQIEEGTRVLSINEKFFPFWKNFLGEERKSIEKPFVHVYIK